MYVCGSMITKIYLFLYRIFSRRLNSLEVEIKMIVFKWIKKLWDKPQLKFQAPASYITGEDIDKLSKEITNYLKGVKDVTN